MLKGLVDLFPATVDLLIRDDNAFRLAVVDVFAGGLRGETTFGERTGRESVRRTADCVTGAEQTFDRRHAVVAPEILGWRNILRARAPGARAGCMGAHDVGLGCGQFGILVLGVHVSGCPQNRLANGHAEEVFPAHLFQVRILESLHRHHMYGAAAGIHFADDAMVAQAGRDRPMGQVRGFRIEIFLADHFLQLGEPLGLVFLAQTILRIGLQVQEIGADRAVTVLEPRQHDAIFHLGHLGAGVDHQPVGRGGRPGRVPGAAGTFAD